MQAAKITTADTSTARLPPACVRISRISRAPDSPDVELLTGLVIQDRLEILVASQPEKAFIRFRIRRKNQLRRLADSPTLRMREPTRHSPGAPDRRVAVGMLAALDPVALAGGPVDLIHHYEVDCPTISLMDDAQ
jgi:hypothetical protein